MMLGASVPEEEESAETWLPRVPYGLVIWLLALVGWVTLAPLAPRVEPPELQLVLPASFVEAAGNLLLLVPLAAVLTISGRTLGKRSRLLRTVLVALLVTLLAESGQWFVGNRFVSLSDVVLNTTGAVAAAILVIVIAKRGLPCVPMAVGLGWLTFVAAAVYIIVGAIYVQESFRLEGWNPRYPILEADEFGGNREYLGAISDAGICAGEGLEEVCATAGAPEPLRAELVHAAERTQVLDLNATVSSASGAQTGPARIVTFSIGPDLRNATLAQEGDDLVFRVRTPLTLENGSSPAFYLPNAIPTGRSTTVRGRFERGTVMMQTLDERGERATLFRVGHLNGWLMRGFVTKAAYPGYLERAEVVGAMVLACALGMAAAWLFSDHGRLLLVLCPLVAATLTLVAGARPVATHVPWSLVIAIVAALGGVGLGLADRRTLFGLSSGEPAG